MNKIKEYNYIIIIALIVIGGFFYWYEYRPSYIKKKCASDAMLMREENCAGVKKYRVYLDSPDEERCLTFDKYFDKCLKQKGL